MFPNFAKSGPLITPLGDVVTADASDFGDRFFCR